MSRSNQSDIVNPSSRWMEWNGEKGVIKFFDKDLKENVEVDPNNMTFIFLDQLSTIKGWHDASESGIYSNEIKDITKDPLIVKSFKGGPLASGFYKEIKDKIISVGGHYTASIYIAFKMDNNLKIANIQLKGAALNEWIEFAKKNRKDILKKAVSIIGVGEGIKGRVIYKVPLFAIKEVSESTNKMAVALDIELQDYLKKYFEKNTTEQVNESPVNELSVTESAQIETPPLPTKEPDYITEPFVDDLPF